MQLRSTILFIGSDERDHQLFKDGINMVGNRMNFLAVEQESMAAYVVKKSLPFWFNAIIVDPVLPHSRRLGIINAIRSVAHLVHVPVIVYSDLFKISDIEELRQLGVTHLMPKPGRVELVANVIHSIENNQELPFLLSFVTEPNERMVKFAS